jgi:hypothetical protein
MRATPVLQGCSQDRGSYFRQGNKFSSNSTTRRETLAMKVTVSVPQSNFHPAEDVASGLYLTPNAELAVVHGNGVVVVSDDGTVESFDFEDAGAVLVRTFNPGESVTFTE